MEFRPNEKVTGFFMFRGQFYIVRARERTDNKSVFKV